jgi:N-acetylneuraminic acid mutarotase
MRLVYQWLLVLILLICATNPVSAATTAADSTPGFWPPAGNLATYSARAVHTAVWTGTEMIIWGGTDNEVYFNTGARYNPATDTWTPISTSNAPTGRVFHTAVWTGTEMIVWGGMGSTGLVNTGGRYNPATDTWTPISTSNAPTARIYYTAVWTGTEMIVWGGTGGDVVNTGGRYNPDTDTWTPIPTINAPAARAQHTAVWTGTEMIVWGGSNSTNFFNTGGRYNPTAPDDVAWTPVTATNAPNARGYHTAVWTGTEMIVWGGTDLVNYFNTGGRYNPALATWSSTPTANAPVGRYYHTAVWTGTEMVVWGGKDSKDSKDTFFDIGGVYNPAASDDVAWTPTTTTNAPVGRYYHTAVWTGTGMIVWGGYDNNNKTVFGTGGRYYTSNLGPTISDISDRTTIINAPIPAIPFTVGDRETGAITLTLNAISSNPVLLPDENILLEGSGADRTITVSPVAGETGTTTISLTVSDGVNTATHSFMLTVDPHRVWLPLISTVSD